MNVCFFFWWPRYWSGLSDDSCQQLYKLRSGLTSVVFQDEWFVGNLLVTRGSWQTGPLEDVNFYWTSGFSIPIWVFPSMVVPPKYPKMIICSRKTIGYHHFRKPPYWFFKVRTLWLIMTRTFPFGSIIGRNFQQVHLHNVGTDFF